MKVSKNYIERLIETGLENPSRGVVISQNIADTVRKNRKAIKKIMKLLRKKEDKK